MPRRNVFIARVAFVVAASLTGCAAEPAGIDFIADARTIHRVLACAPGALPVGVEREAVAEHCRRLSPLMERYRREFAGAATPFIARLLPRDLPPTVFYPFGGTDLAAALVTYPDAKEYITVSLESAGDPRAIAGARGESLRRAFSEALAALAYLLGTNDSSNANARALERGIVPNQLLFSLAALTLFEGEPLSLRYFRIEADGSIHYHGAREIAALEGVKTRRLYATWVDPDATAAFRNMELIFKKKNGVTAVYRHLAANLDDRHFASSPLRRYLEGYRRIAAMTKAASYLLWRDDFSALRGYLLSRMTVMVSDSTGILPRHARAAGFEPGTYGVFNAAFLSDGGGAGAVEMRALWQSQPRRELPFRYGYSDAKAAAHLVVYTREAESAQ